MRFHISGIFTHQEVVIPMQTLVPGQTMVRADLPFCCGRWGLRRKSQGSKLKFRTIPHVDAGSTHAPTWDDEIWSFPG